MRGSASRLSNRGRTNGKLFVTVSKKGILPWYTPRGKTRSEGEVKKLEMTKKKDGSHQQDVRDASHTKQNGLRTKGGKDV